MTRAAAVQFQKVFGFDLQLRDRDGVTRDFGLAQARWDGPHLVLTRGMRSRAPSLFEELRNVESIIVRLQTTDGDREVDRMWEIQHDGMRDRGFLFMDAMLNAVALEAVCLLFATLTPVSVARSTS